MQDTQQSKRKQMTTTNNGKTERQPVTAVWRNGGFSASYDSFVICSSAVLRLNFCAKNPPLRQAAKRYAQAEKRHSKMTMNRERDYITL